MKEKDLVIKGRVFSFADDVDTDQIIPARYLDTSDPAKLAQHCMEGVDEKFVGKVKAGDIIFGGRNFGCGSSREHAPLAIKGCGVGAVVAKSFARIFFRNAINIGLPILESEDFEAKTGDEVQINLTKGTLINITTGEQILFDEFPPFLTQIINAGGLMNYIVKTKKDGQNER
ncbi:3-isopropylmalate dehydratase small subunit [Elusimicrobiota bacterium]